MAVWDRQIIATVSCLPAGLFLKGVAVDADWLTDVRIHWGLARQAMQALRRAGVRPTAVFPNGLAAALFDHPHPRPIQLGKHIGEAMMTIGQRIGFRALPDAGNQMRRVSVRWPLQQAIGAPLGTVLASVADLGIGRLPRASLPVQVWDQPFDGRFDALWDDVRGGYPAITRRDAAVLAWHYSRHPDTAYRTLVVQRGVALRGYLVFKVWNRRGRRIARIVDLLATCGDTEVVAALVASALRLLGRAAAERVDWFISGSWLAAVAEGLGFVPRRTTQGRLQPLLARGLPPVALYVTSGDGDGG